MNIYVANITEDSVYVIVVIISIFLKNFFQIDKHNNHSTLLFADSPYHDVSGLPDPYMDQMEQEDSKPPPQHMSLSYDESLESGYSTPNSRNRRVIREIIV